MPRLRDAADERARQWTQGLTWEPTHSSHGHLDRRTAAAQWRAMGMEAAAWSTGRLRTWKCAQNEDPNGLEAVCEGSNCRMYRWLGVGGQSALVWGGGQPWFGNAKPSRERSSRFGTAERMERAVLDGKSFQNTDRMKVSHPRHSRNFKGCTIR